MTEFRINDINVICSNEQNKTKFTYFNELEGSDRGQSSQMGVEEWACGVGGVLWCDAVGDPLRRGRPVGGGECEAIVRARVYRVHLRYQRPN